MKPNNSVTVKAVMLIPVTLAYGLTCVAGMHGPCGTGFLSAEVSDSVAAVADLPLPAVPDTLRVPTERAAYVAAHFWDALDFSDTLRCRDERFMERNLVNFFSLFPHADTAAVVRSVDLLMRRAGADTAAYTSLCRLAAKYLYEKASPMRDERYYSMFLKNAAKSPVIGAADRDRASFLLDAISKNRPETVAADFAFITRDGLPATLMQMPARITILIFYDPDCDHCATVVSRLSAEASLRRLAKEGQLAVLAVYADGDTATWQRTKHAMPDWWTVGLDTGDISRRDLYFMPEMPSLYLLGADKTVLLKDASADEIVKAVDDMFSGVR